MVKNILVIKHGSFGDIIQINGCLRDIREHYSKYKIYILTTPAFNKYFDKCPFVDEVIFTQEVLDYEKKSLNNAVNRFLNSLDNRTNYKIN